jgi:hypothetical protein
MVIARNGLTLCLRNRWMQYVVMLCWMASLVMAVFLFLVGQLLVADSIVVQWVGNFNPQLQMFASLLTTWLEQHPEISVRTTQNLLFYYFSSYLLLASIFALGMAIPLMITRDLASNAIVIYSSKAVSRMDYLIGKFGMAFGLLTLTLLGPACAAWFVGNLLAPDWRFFWHSRSALGNTLVFSLTSMALLSILALGVSAISRREKATPAFWYIWWIIGGVVAPIAMHTRPWLRHLSFHYNLEQISLGIFRLGNDIAIARDNIPVFGDMLRNIPPQTMEGLNSPAVPGAIAASLVMLVVAALVIRNRVKPE